MAPPPRPSPAGRDADDRPVVPGYRLGALLGAGGSARVWRAVEEDTGDDVAVKVTALHDGADPTAARAEGALLAAFDHPHLLRVRAVVGVVADDARRPAVALVLDLAAAGSLADLLRRRGRLAPGEVVTALAPVAAALAHVHDEGLVHADVTPGNVLFRADGAPVLADLGVSRVVGAYGEVRTTPAYADPFVAAGGTPAPASDVFMLAATAVHALTGVPPWPDPLPGAAMARAATGAVAPVLASLVEQPGPLVDVLAEALCPEPHLRPSAAAFALDLRRAVTPVPVEFAAGRSADRPGRSAWTARPVSTGRRETHRVDDGAAPAPPAAAPARGRRGARAVRRRPAAAPPPPGRHAARPRTPGPSPRGTRRPVPAAAAVLVGLVALAAAVLGVVDARGGTARQRAAGTTAAAASATRAPASAAPSRAAATASAPAWTDVLAALDGTRAAAYAARNPASLARVYAPGALLEGDRTELVRLVPSGCGLSGARTRYLDVTPAVGGAGAPPVVLTARATLAPSTLRCPGHADVPVDGVPATDLRITLVAAPDGGYRISAQQRA